MNSIDVLLGALMPLVVAVVNQSHWSPRRRGLVAVVLCVLAASVASLIRGDNWGDWRTTAVVVVGSALVSYRVWWQPTTIAPAIEAATTLGTHTVSRL